MLHHYIEELAGLFILSTFKLPIFAVAIAITLLSHRRAYHRTLEMHIPRKSHNLIGQLTELTSS